MNFSESELERFSFLWSEARLIIAAVALLIGGVPPLLRILPSVPLVGTILTLSWLISGATACYLLYRWFSSNKRVFGSNDVKDTAAFLISVVSGINLGLVALLGRNIGMNISSSYIVFIVTAIVYLIAAWHLYQRWNAEHQRVF